MNILVVRYLKTKVKYICVLLIFASLFFVGNKYLQNKYAYKLKEKTFVLLLGESQLKNGLNPEYIVHSENVGQFAEPWVLSYIKLRYLLKKNSQIKIVVIPISPIHFKPRFDDLFGEYVFATEFFSRMATISTYKDFKPFKVPSTTFYEQYIRYNVVPASQYITKYFMDQFDYEYQLEYPFIGAYEPMKAGNKVYDYKYLVEHLYHKGDIPHGEINAQYIDSIASLTSRLNKKLVIISMPVHREFYKNVPDSIKNYMDFLVQKAKKYPNVSYLPCDTLLDNDLFFDYAHLAEKGAKELSIVTNTFIKGL